MKNIFAIVFGLLFTAAIVGCVSAKATKTTVTKNLDGTTTTRTEEVSVNGLLENISDGVYTSTNSDGTATTLSTSSATPDQKSIATLSGGVVELGKAALLLAGKAPTNSPAANTNQLLEAPGPRAPPR